MIYGPAEMSESFRTVRKNTVRVAEDIPEEKYSFRAAPGVMTVREMLAHVALMPQWMLSLHRDERRTSFEGMDFPSLFQQAKAAEDALQTKSQVIEALQRGGDEFASWLSTVSGDFLAEKFTMPPGSTPATKTRLEMLLGTKEHEMHHRAQLMLIERILGIVPHLTREREERMAQSATPART